MKPQRQCNQCGKPLPEGAEDANCPTCLLEWGLGASPDDSTTVLGGAEPVPLEPPVPGPTEHFRRLPYFGDYELLEEIARGGMGVVYRARQVSLNRTVAVKMILAAQFAGQDAILRFQTEARAAARLQHPHIVGIHEVGEHEGFHYFSMDYVEGKNLGQTIREEPVSPRRAAEWVKTTAETIHYAHEQGILHRDLKPSNIMIDPAGGPHVTDFGLAKQIEGHSDITVSGQILGSPNYMPPEQAGVRRGQVGRASDVYSLGAVLYHLLAGRPPFIGENAATTLHAVLHQEVTAPRLMNPNTPPDLETICLKCLEKEPSRRYQIAQELADELGRFLRDEPILACPISRREKTWRWCRRKPVIAALAASLVVVFLAGLAGVLTQLRRAENKSEENRQQVARLNVLTGVQLMQSGDYFKSLLWFAEALATDRGAPERDAIHRMRIASVLEQCPKLVQIISHDGQPIAAASFNPTDDRLATVGADRTARVWGIPDGQLLMKTQPFGALPYSITFSPDGSRLLVVLLDNTARLLDPVTGQETCAPLPHRLEGAFFPVFDPTGTRLLTQPNEKQLQMWDGRSGQPIGQRLVHINQIERAQFSADSSRLFTRAQSNFAWATQTGESVPFPANGPGANDEFFLSSHSNVAVIGGRIWKWPSHEPRSSRREEAQPSKSEIRNPKSELGMNPITSAATPVGEALMDPALLMWAAFSPSGDRLMTASRDRTARIWDAATAMPLTQALPHDQIVQHAAFSPDGRRVLTVSQDNLRRGWDADTGQPLTPPISHAASARGSAFSGSGRYFLTVHPEFLACVWDLHPEAVPPVLLKPLQSATINEVAARGNVSVSQEMNNLIRVRSLVSGLDVPLHPISMKIVPMQAWLDGTSRFVILEGEMAKVQVWDAASGMPITPLVQSQYTLDEIACKTVKLPSFGLPAPEAMDLAQLLSGSRLDGTGGWTSLKLEEITAAWERLTRHSALRPSQSAIEEWHEQEAKAAAGALDWFAAAFHWEQLAQLHPDRPEFAQLRSYAEQCLARARATAKNSAELRRVIPPRDPRADARMIDLSDHYTGAVTEGLQIGVQTLGGVKFDVRGKIELFGLGAEGRGARRPEKVSGIKVQERCARFHLLHTARWANTLEGESMATLVVAYANGQIEKLAIQNRVQVSGEWSAPQFAPKQAEVAWIGTNPFANSLQLSVWLYKYTWSNPHPDWEVSHIDLVSAKTEASYILVALTLD